MLRHLRAGSGIAALVVTTALLLTGCVPDPNQGGQSDTRLFLGPLPAPAPLPDAPDIPPFPKVPTSRDASAMAAYNKALDAYSAAFQAEKPKADAETAAIEKLAETALAGGEKGVAAWQSLLVMAGVSVLGGDGKPVTVGGQTGFGSPMTDADLRLQALLAAAPGGIRLTDLAEILSPAFGIAGAELAGTLYEELNRIPDFGFRVVLWSVGPPLYDGTAMVPADQVVLSWAQVGLLLHRIADEILASSAITAGAAGAAGTGGAPSADGAGLQVGTASFRGPSPARARSAPARTPTTRSSRRS